MIVEIYKRQQRLRWKSLVGPVRLRDEWRFRIKGSNGEPMASGQGYYNQRDAIKALETITRTFYRDGWLYDLPYGQPVVEIRTVER